MRGDYPEDGEYPTVEVTVPGDYPDGGESLQSLIEGGLSENGVQFSWLDFGTFIPPDVRAVGFAMGVSDLERGVSILARTLKDAGVPPDTTLRTFRPEEKTFTLGEMA